MLRIPLFLASLATTFIAQTSAASVCNGHAELCDRLYSNVTFLATHNSFAVGASIADNQNKDVVDQLNDGIRTLVVQAHNGSDGIHLCHSSCQLEDGGTLTAFLTKVTSWVQSNPNEVITLVIVNSDTLAPTQFAQSFDSSGLSNYAYSPPSASQTLYEWPSMGTLIDSGKTVLTFMDYNADFSTVPYIMDEFSNMWQDAYDVTEVGWECAVNRSSGNAGSMMMLINHFLDNTYSLGGTTFFVPRTSALNTTNSAESIGEHTSNCASIWGRNPNHILLDFYDTNGNAPFDLVAQLNSVSEPTNTVTPVPVDATASVVPSGAAAGVRGAASTGQNAQITSSSLSGGMSRAKLSWTQWTFGLTFGAVGLVLGGMSVL